MKAHKISSIINSFNAWFSGDKKRAGENRLSPFKTTPIYKYQLLLKSIRITATYILKYRFLSLDTFNLVMICLLSTRLNLFGTWFSLVQKPIARFFAVSEFWIRKTVGKKITVKGIEGKWREEGQAENCSMNRKEEECSEKIRKEG